MAKKITLGNTIVLGGTIYLPGEQTIDDDEIATALTARDKQLSPVAEEPAAPAAESESAAAAKPRGG